VALRGVGTMAGWRIRWESVAREFVKAINRHDLETLATLMPEEHRFIDSLGRVVEGREKVRAGWVEYFRMVSDYSIELQETFIRGPVVVMLDWRRAVMRWTDN